MADRFSLAIDYGSRYVGVALLSHDDNQPNQVLYAGVLVLSKKTLDKAIKPRAMARRIRRTKKTHGRRLRRLAQALRGIVGADEIVRFCRRRGYTHDLKETDSERPSANAISRDEFFAALGPQIDRIVPEDCREYVRRACARHLNAARRRTAELRPARFDNRRPSKCQWTGCERNVPRKRNAMRELLGQTLFVWLKPVFDQSPDKSDLRGFIERQIDRLVGLMRGYQKLPDGSRKSPFAVGKKRVFDEILRRVAAEPDAEAASQFAENWKETYAKQLTDILKGQQEGRLRFCREHSREYVDYFLDGKVYPQRATVHVTDLFGRSQQIVFERIWRLVAVRLLPRTGGRIDRVVVERTAFDILGGPLKDRVKAMQNDDRVSEMNWHGPMWGYASREEMLKEEFDGRCAYCGRQGPVMEVEHLLPRSEFPFDSYFNILPACAECNRRKGARGMMEAGMRIHPDAYKAYSAYVAQRRPPHVYHQIKKGMLNLMTRETGEERVQRQLALLCNNLVEITATQRGPRPLARFLASRIEHETGLACSPQWISGRHTTLYRRIALPEFDKAADKASEGLVNHAVDAIIAGCEFPSATAIENREWNITPRRILDWREKVRRVSPELIAGTSLPKVRSGDRLEHFEQDLEHGYVRIDLSAFNWNRQRQSNIAMDPFGRTAKGLPLKRKPADDILQGLLSEKNRDKEIANIAHARLRALLEGSGSEAAERFVRWLQQSTRRGLEAAQWSEHPSDQARRAALEEFVRTPPEEFLGGKSSAKEKRKAIPETIGVRCVNRGVQGRLDIARSNGAGTAPQRYAAQPRYREVYVGYRDGEGGLDRSAPVVFTVDQAYAVRMLVTNAANPQLGNARSPVQEPGSPLAGRTLGDSVGEKEFLARWRDARDALLRREGVVRVFRVTQGCYIEKTDGTGFQLQNFDGQQPWMKNRPFHNIRRVLRSPLRAARE